MDTICNDHRNRFGTDRHLWVERPGIMSMPAADSENPCGWCKNIKKLDINEKRIKSYEFPLRPSKVWKRIIEVARRE